MSEQEINNIQAEQTTAQDEQSDQTEQSASEQPAKSKKSAKGAKGDKNPPLRPKGASPLEKEWEDSIVASKKVKREEMRRKLKRAMLILLVFSLITTSVVYIMLLFVQENNIRITASNRNKEKSISLSMDNDFWTPYLNAEGPEHMWNISYDVRYKPSNLTRLPKLPRCLRRTKCNLAHKTASNLSDLFSCSKTRATRRRTSTMR